MGDDAGTVAPIDDSGDLSERSGSSRRIRLWMPWSQLTVPLTLVVVVYVIAAGMALLIATLSPQADLPGGDLQPSIWGIFLNNVGVLLWLWTGVLTYGVSTIATIGLNGMIIGWVLGKLFAEGTLGQAVTGLLPHFLPEIGAYVIAAATSVALSVRLFRRFFAARSDRTSLRPVLVQWLVAQLCAAGLLAVAAVIEVLVSTT